VSSAIAAGNDDPDYKDMKTPGELEDGALAEGGALSLYTREAMGLFAQYAAVGMIYGLLPQLQYPVFNNYLQMEGYQTVSYGVLVNMGWSFKVLWGMLSDCMPIRGYRRKPWMLIGWGATLICIGLLTFIPFGEPYCLTHATNPEYCDATYEKVNATLYKQSINPDARESGYTFIILSMLASFGYVIADCAADAMVVQYARREPIAVRGRVQTAIYVVRTLFSIISITVVGFLMNGSEYQGDFGFALRPNTVYGMLLVPSAMVVFSTIFLVVDVPVPAVPFSVYLGNFWELMKMRVMWQICAFRFISGVFMGFSATPIGPIGNNWAGVTPLNDSLSGIIGNLIFAGVMTAVGKYGLHWNWRWTIAVNTIGVILVDGAVMFITVWDIFRNQWFYTGVALADNLPGAIRFIVSTYCAVEIADLGNEGAVYGLVTTISNLSYPFASVIYKMVDAEFEVSVADLQEDNHHVRMEVTWTLLISYIMKTLSLVWLFMLPPQKAEMQELKKKGGRSTLAAFLLLIGFLFALTWSVMTNIMSIFPSTRCLRIAGGRGC
jgi:hypothetical protein